MKKLIVLGLIGVGIQATQALPLFEPFNYPAGVNLIGQSNADFAVWFQAGPNTAVTNQPTILAGNLSYAGLPPSTGGSMKMGGGGGMAARLQFGGLSAGSFYYSFICRINDITGLNPTNGVFWAGLNNSAGSQVTTPTTASARVVTKSSGGGFQLGLDKGTGTAGDFVFDPTIFNVGDVIFIIGRYTFNTGSTTDDETRMWLNVSSNTFGSLTEPPTSSLTNSTGADQTSFASFLFLNRVADEPLDITIDELRIGTNWAEVTASTAYPNTLVKFDPSGLSGTPTNFQASATNANVVATLMTRGSGLTIPTATGASYNNSGWSGTNASSSLSTNDFVTFTIAPLANYSLGFTGLKSVVARSGTGPDNAAWVYGLDTFSSLLAMSTPISTVATAPTALNGTLTNSGVTVPVEFRLIAWSDPAAGSGGTLRLGNAYPVVLSGSATLRSASTLLWGDWNSNCFWSTYNPLALHQSNWDLNKTPTPGLMDTLVFAGSIGLNPTNDIPGLNLNAICFEPAAGAFNIRGNGFMLNSGVTNSSANAQVIHNDLAVAFPQVVVSSDSTLNLRGWISGVGGLNKVGPGTLVLSGANTYEGDTTVNAGTLKVDNLTGNATGSGTVVVNAGATLAGSGTVGAVTLKGRISPGASPGTLNTGSETWSSEGTLPSFAFEINDVDAGAGANPGWDFIDIIGGLTINAPSNSFIDVEVISESLANTPGDVHDFTNTSEYTWTIVRTTTGVINFNPAAFRISTSNFSNPLGNGCFAVALANGSNDLVLQFVQKPAIVTSPVSVTVECGSNHTFTVSASGTAPLHYYWRRNGTPVGTDAPTLSTGPATLAMSGNSYQVEVSNACGTALSAPAILNVVETTLPTITAQPQSRTNFVGSTATFSATASSCGPVTYQWYFGTNALPNQTNATLTLNNVQTNNAGGYQVAVSNSAGTTNSTTATLTVVELVGPVLSVDFNLRTADPVANTFAGFSSFLINSNGSSSLKQTNATVRTFGGLTVSLTGNGTDPGYVDRLRATPTNSATFTQALLLRDFVFSQDLSANAGLNVAIDGLVPNQVYAITIWSFDTGSVRPRVSDWFGNGSLGKDNYTFDGTITQPTNDAQYQFTFKATATVSGQLVIQGRRDSSTAANDPGVFLNAFQLTPSFADPPTIVKQPLPSTVYAGDNTAFSVQVGGTAPFALQWRKDEVAILDATNTTLIISNAQVAQSGLYSIVVSNAAGSTTSSNAQLAVLPVANVTSGLLAHWALNQLGTSTPDASGNGNTLFSTNMDASNLGPGRCGRAPTFNGVDEYLVLNHNTNGGLPASSYPAYTVALWVKGNFTGQSDRRVFAESATNNNSPLLTIGTDSAGTNSSVDIFIRNSDGSTPANHRKSSLPAFDGNWHHIAWVDNNSFGKLYVDGVEDTNNFNYTRGSLGLTTISLGAIQRATAASFFNGMIDDAAIWRRSLSPAEIQYVINNGPRLAPSITCPPDVTAPVDAGQNTASNVNLGNPELGQCNVTSVTNNAPATYPLGTTTVTWTVIDLNSNSATCQQNVTVITNRPPVAGDNGGATTVDRPLGIALGKLLANDSDPNGDPLTVISVSPTSTNGGSVSLTSSNVIYTPKPAFAGVDRFSYTISDGFWTATAQVEILVTSGTVPSQNQVSLEPTPNGYRIRFAGIPGNTYQIQRATSVTGPWAPLVTLTAPLHGIIEFEDTNPPLPSAFYRTVAQ